MNDQMLNLMKPLLHLSLHHVLSLFKLSSESIDLFFFNQTINATLPLYSPQSNVRDIVPTDALKRCYLENQQN